MALRDMVQRLVLEVPGLASPYAKTLINEALNTIYDQQMWSWQLQQAGWLTPGLLFATGPGTSAGTITVTPFTNTIIGDTVASTAWQAYIAGNNRPFLTELQIRSPFYALYDIVKLDTTSNPPFTTITLDRPWMEPGGVAQSYMIYQAYFVVPVPDFKRFLTARDTTDNCPIDFWTKTQQDLAVEDPERTNFDLPAYFVPFGTDQRASSSTLGNMRYEIWPHALSVLPYSFGYLRRGPQLVNPGDTLPYPLTEEAVLWQAKVAAFLNKEASKGEQMQRGSGADYRFLAGAAEAQYKLKIKPIKDTDDALVNLYMSKFRRNEIDTGEPFATTTGQVNVGRF